MTVTAGVTVAVMCVLHLLSALVLKGIVAKILNLVNIVLHIALMVPMMLAGFDISLAVMLYMVSVFCYSLSSYIRYALDERKRRKEAEEV